MCKYLIRFLYNNPVDSKTRLRGQNSHEKAFTYYDSYLCFGVFLTNHMALNTNIKSNMAITFLFLYLIRPSQLFPAIWLSIHTQP